MALRDSPSSSNSKSIIWRSAEYQRLQNLRISLFLSSIDYPEAEENEGKVTTSQNTSSKSAPSAAEKQSTKRSPVQEHQGTSKRPKVSRVVEISSTSNVTPMKNSNTKGAGEKRRSTGDSCKSGKVKSNAGQYPRFVDFLDKRSKKLSPAIDKPGETKSESNPAGLTAAYGGRVAPQETVGKKARQESRQHSQPSKSVSSALEKRSAKRRLPVQVHQGTSKRAKISRVVEIHSTSNVTQKENSNTKETGEKRQSTMDSRKSGKVKSDAGHPRLVNFLNKRSKKLSCVIDKPGKTKSQWKGRAAPQETVKKKARQESLPRMAASSGKDKNITHGKDKNITNLELWATSCQNVLDQAVNIVSSKLSFEGDLRTYLKHVPHGEDRQHADPLPEPVITSVLGKINKKVAQNMDRDHLHKRLGQLIYGSAVDYTARKKNSTDFWAAFDKNVNLPPPVECPKELDATASQRWEYQSSSSKVADQIVRKKQLVESLAESKKLQWTLQELVRLLSNGDKSVKTEGLQHIQNVKSAVQGLLSNLSGE